MLAANYPIILDRAADWSKSLTIRNGAGAVVNLTSISFRGTIRNAVTKTPILNFTFTKTNAVGGIVKFSLTDTQTRSLLSSIKYEYDIFMDNGDSDIRLLEGSVTSRDNITL